MKILSLCSGYGGLDMAVEQHFSAKTAYWSDVDETACDVMAARFPDAEPIGDLTTLDLTMLHADIITAGFPCQPFSLAGYRRGNEDERAIFSWIADSVGVVRPRYVFLENVAAITPWGGGIVGALTELGYDSRWGIVRASDAGGPHRRARWFCLARNTDNSSIRAFGKIQGESTDTARTSGDAVTDAEGAEWRSAQHEHMETPTRPATESRERPSAVGWGKYGPVIRRWERVLGRPAPDPITDGKLSAGFVEWMMGLESGHVTDIAASRAKALACLGNGVVPHQAKRALELLT